MKKNKHLFILLLLIVLLTNLPTLKRMKAGNEYFSTHSAPDDVWNQYFYIRTVLKSPEKLDGVKFAKEEDKNFQQAIWGYSIASLALVDSNFTQEAQEQLKFIIKNLETKIFGYNKKIQNQQARLSLFYNIYDCLFQDTTFHKKSYDLMIKLFQEIEEEEYYYRDVELFHSLSLASNPELHLSFAIFNKFSTTNFKTNSQKWLTAFRKTINQEPENETTKNLNWNTIFLSGINNPLADSLFQKFNQIDEFIKKKPEITLELLIATAAARAVEDRANFIKLVRFIKKNAQPTYEGSYLFYDKLDLTENTLFLFAKVCRFHELMLRNK